MDAAQDASDLVGSVLAGRYRIVQKLGEGAMGAVYLGEHLRIGRRDAIKVLRDPLAADKETIARFMRGARILSSIHHPNVCTIYDFGDTADGLQFLAMELVLGESLKDLLDRERVLPPPRATRIALQVADALQAAHEQDVVHRDLKPANIMVVPGKAGEDTIKVVDFDIAKGPRDEEGAEVTRLGFVVGTPEYMSPEQLIGERLDGRSDIYSLGLVLFRMLSGVLPFRASSLQEMMVERLTQTPLTLAEVCPDAAFPPGLQLILSRALARRAEERYASAAEMQRDLVAVLAELGGASPRSVTAATLTHLPRADEVPATQIAPASGRGAEPAPPRRAGRRLLGGAALAAVLVGGVGGAWWLRDGRVPKTVDAGKHEAAQIDSLRRDSLRQDSLRQLAILRDSLRRDSLVRDSLRKDSLLRASSQSGPMRPPAQSDPRVTLPPRLDPSTYGDLVLRQLDRLGAGARGARQLAVIRDSALLVYNAESAGSRERANAAFAIANAWLAEQNTPNMRRWLRRALELRPGYKPYQDLIDAYPEDP